MKFSALLWSITLTSGIILWIGGLVAMFVYAWQRNLWGFLDGVTMGAIGFFIIFALTTVELLQSSNRN